MAAAGGRGGGRRQGHAAATVTAEPCVHTGHGGRLTGDLETRGSVGTLPEDGEQSRKDGVSGSGRAPHGRRPFASGAGVRARSVWISSHRERGDRISAAGPRQTALTTRHFKDSRPRAGEPRGPPPEASAELENSRQPHVPAEPAHGKTLPPEPWITVGREPRTGLGRTRQTRK